MKHETREFALFPEACINRGISRPVAFNLVAAGALDTFKIGRRRYVYIDSLLTLPERIDQYEQFILDRRSEKKRRRG